MVSFLSRARKVTHKPTVKIVFTRQVSVGTSSMNSSNPGMNSVVLPAPNLKVEQVIPTVLTRITVHTPLQEVPTATHGVRLSR